MEGLDYDGVVEPWKADLIVARARRMGFRPDEIHDVQQQMIMDVAEFRFDAAKSNGAKESTALQSLIDNQLKKICRANARYRAHLNRLGREVADGRSSPQADIVQDVRAAIATLPEHEQLVGRALAEGYSRPEIARKLGCGWHTVDRIVRRIRRSFEDRGLDPRSRA
jgi:DNA-directed RNA polymerase specialized sigma24 family protein